MKKLLTALTLLLCTAVSALAQSTITLPIAANAVADIGNGPIKVRMIAGNASIFTAQSSGTGSTSGSSTALTLTTTPATPPIVGGLISGTGITSGTTVTAYNGTTGVTLSAAMTVSGGTTVSWGAACPSTPPSNAIQASAMADYFIMYTQARVCAVSPGGPVNTLLISPIFYDQTSTEGSSGLVVGVTSITGGTSPQLLNNNGGVLGQIATGTSGHAIPFLDGTNVWSGANVFTSTVNIGTNVALPSGVLLGVNGQTVPVPNLVTIGGEQIVAEYVAASNNVTGVAAVSFGNLAGFAVVRAEGTAGSLTPVATGSIVGVYDAHGCMVSGCADVTGWSGGAGALAWIASPSGSIWTNTDNGMYASMQATPPGSLASARKPVTNFYADSTSAAHELTGVPGSIVGSKCVANATSGSICLAPPTGALGSAVLTLPDVTDTIAAIAATQTLTNKTIVAPAISGNVTTAGSAPTCAATGIGSTGTCTISAGSSDFAGGILLTAGGSGIVATGTITLTLNASLGVHGAACVLQAFNSTGQWTAPVTLINTSTSATAPIFSWTNASTNLTTSDIYGVQYHCIGI